MSFSFSDNVAVTEVDLYLDGQLYGKSTQAPFTITLNTASLTNGSHTLTANALDAAGNKGVSSNVAITVNNTSTTDTQAPVISIASPAASSTVSGTISVTFNYSDNVGVKYVDLYVDGIPYNRASTAPFTQSLNTLLLTDGSHALTAFAVDAAGNKGASAKVAVIVKNN